MQTKGPCRGGRAKLGRSSVQEQEQEKRSSSAQAEPCRQQQQQRRATEGRFAMFGRSLRDRRSGRRTSTTPAGTLALRLWEPVTLSFDCILACTLQMPCVFAARDFGLLVDFSFTPIHGRRGDTVFRCCIAVRPRFSGRSRLQRLPVDTSATLSRAECRLEAPPCIRVVKPQIRDKKTGYSHVTLQCKNAGMRPRGAIRIPGYKLSLGQPRSQAGINRHSWPQ